MPHLRAGRAGPAIPSLRRNIGLLIEGHVQYQFMTIEQIEKFYSAFYPDRGARDAYYELMRKLKVAPGQRISRMSCGQRSQVALGLILAQNPELLVLDDFSLGLDPGYRRLFVGLPARICPRRVENRLPDLAHHSGYGAPGRRLHHHGLRQHPDCSAPSRSCSAEVRRYTCFTVPEGATRFPTRRSFTTRR